jgi:phosphohistidine phosphatase
MGRLLKREDLVPDIIISSTAIRARATSEAVAKASSYDGEIVLEKSLYAAEPEAYLGTLCQMNMFEF